MLENCKTFSRTVSRDFLQSATFTFNKLPSAKYPQFQEVIILRCLLSMHQWLWTRKANHTHGHYTAAPPIISPNSAAVSCFQALCPYPRIQSACGKYLMLHAGFVAAVKRGITRCLVNKIHFSILP